MGPNLPHNAASISTYDYKDRQVSQATPMELSTTRSLPQPKGEVHSEEACLTLGVGDMGSEEACLTLGVGDMGSVNCTRMMTPTLTEGSPCSATRKKSDEILLEDRDIMEKMRTTVEEFVIPQSTDGYNWKCDRIFKCQRNLYFHHRREHKDPTSCSLCTRKFSSKVKFLGHMKKSHGPKPSCTYLCSRCGKKFGRSDNFRRHDQSCGVPCKKKPMNKLKED